MAYNENIPQATDTLQSSQLDLLNNFIALKSFVDIDHETFGNANEGAHKQITLPAQTAAPAFAGTNAGMYGKISTLTSKNEVHVHATGLPADIPMTAASLAEPGWAYLPCGLLIKWGRTTKTGLLQTVTFPVGATIPVFTAVFSAQVSTNINGDAFACIAAYSTTTLTVNCTKRTSTASESVRFDYLVIGK